VNRLLRSIIIRYGIKAWNIFSRTMGTMHHVPICTQYSRCGHIQHNENPPHIDVESVSIISSNVTWPSAEIIFIRSDSCSPIVQFQMQISGYCLQPSPETRSRRQETLGVWQPILAAPHAELPSIQSIRSYSCVYLPVCQKVCNPTQKLIWSTKPPSNLTFSSFRRYIAELQDYQ
jgi:hypothetical protein